MNFIENTILFSRKIYKAIQSVYVPTNYIFFANVNTPYIENKVNLYSPRSATPIWVYSPDTRKFTAWGDSDALFSHALPVLSIEILENDEVMYDLTDFIETIRVYNTQKSPSLTHIIYAWVLSSELILDPHRIFTIRYMTDTAETYIESFNNIVYSIELAEESEEEAEESAKESVKESAEESAKESAEESAEESAKTPPVDLNAYDSTSVEPDDKKNN